MWLDVGDRPREAWRASLLELLLGADAPGDLEEFIALSDPIYEVGVDHVSRYRKTRLLASLVRGGGSASRHGVILADHARLQALCKRLPSAPM
jgi:hypothetical protein